jgi:predicted PurR-regulated permease PerM
VDERPGLLSHPTVTRIARWGVVAWSLIGVGYLALLAYRYLLHPVRVVFAPLVLALAIVYLLNPMVSWMERHGVARLWGSLLTYLVFLGAVGVGLRYLIPVIADQVSGFVASVPELLERAQDSLNDLKRRLDLNIDTSSLVTSLGPGGGGSAFISRIFSITAGVVHVAFVAVLGIVLGFYLLVDLPKIQKGALALIPSKRRPAVLSILERMGRALGGFFRGQLLVALFVGLASMAGLYIVGLPYWALVGLIAGLFNLIPLIGPFIGAVPALFIAFTTADSCCILRLEPGWTLAVGASVALLIVQQIDNHIISPNVVARTVKLHPVTVMLGLLVAGTLFGLSGMLLAVPVIAAVKILVLHYWDTRMQWPPAAVPQTPWAGEGTGEDAAPGEVPGEEVAEDVLAPPELRDDGEPSDQALSTPR